MRTIAKRASFPIQALFLLTVVTVANCGGSSNDGDGGPDAPVAGSGGGLVGGGGGGAGGGAGGGIGGAIGSTTCGAPGYGCCPGNTCNGGGCCVNSICVPKGAICATLEGTCNDGVCGTCGGAGMACCSGSLCTAAGTKCVAGLCGRCGGSAGTLCCNKLSTTSTENTCLDDSLICGTSDYCVSCGKPGDACCPGSKCEGGGCCFGGRCVAEAQACSTTAGTCKAGRCSGCGAASQACCGGSTCYDNLLCSSNGLCSSCGGLGEPCCAATAPQRCQAGGLCTATSSTGTGLCAACGGLGQSCCGDGKCSQGCCSGTRCVEGTSTPSGACGSTGAGGSSGGTGVPAGCTGVSTSPCASGRMPRLTGTQVLDGSDSEFCGIPAFELNFANAGRVLAYNTGGTRSERVVAKVAWSGEGIHAYLRVFDSTIVSAPSLANIWNGDGVELLFSSSTSLTGNTSTDGNTYHVIVSPAATVGGISFAASSRSSYGTGTQTALESGRYVVVTLADGYAVELKVPWPMLIPTVGSNIGFDLQLNSADGPMGLSDSYVRDAQAILYQGTGTGSSCGTTIAPYCDDRLWCVVQLQ